MPRSRHSLRRPSRSHLALFSVLVLLASACFPVLAQAETVYETEGTTLPGETKTDHGKATNNPPKESSENGEAEKSGVPPVGNTNEGGGGSEEGPSEATGDGGKSQGNQDNGSQTGNGSKSEPKGTAKLAENKPVAVADVSPNTSSSDSGGSSSPLVPILIAIAALAAISIGVFLVRQRREDSGPDGQAPQKAN